MTRVAIITARGGSKRIPRKNIKPFFGKPIIAYSIQAAKDAQCFDEIMVSTDDKEISEVALNYGATIPFFRSAQTSDDFSGTVDVLLEVLREYERRGKKFDQACCLYPAAPLITPDLLLSSLRVLEASESLAVVPVAPFPSSIWRALKIADGKLERLWDTYEKSRSQDLPETYYDVGQFYWMNVQAFLRDEKIIGNSTVPFILSPRQIQDIDTEEDWKEAEYKYRMLQKN